jgi:hypothetical protein
LFLGLYENIGYGCSTTGTHYLAPHAKQQKQQQNSQQQFHELGLVQR